MTLEANSASPPAERSQFFARTAIAMAAIVLLSFPLTYYLPVATGSRQFQALLHIHAATCFAWIGLYAWQAHLLAGGRLARHRELGLSGFALTGILIPLGFWTAQRSAALRMAEGMERPYEFTWYNFADISIFSLLMIASILLVSRHKEWHRRLTYVAALALVAPAATRWTLKVPGVDPFILDMTAYLVIYPFLIALALFDRRSLGRLHPATLTCLALLVPLHFSSAFIARSDWWNNLAPALIGPL